MIVFRIYWQVLRHINLRGYNYIWGNLVWVVISLGVVTAPAAWAGLVRLSHRAQTTPNAGLHDFWEGFRERFWIGLIIGMLTAVIVIVNVTNLIAYSTVPGLLAVVLRVAWISALLLWISVLLYFWPLLEEMEQPTVWGGLRNAFLMVLQNPFYTLGLWPGLLMLMLLSTIFFPTWLLLTGGVIAALSTTVTLDRLAATGYRNSDHYQPIEEQY